jgi:hypothetical protein
MLRPILLETGYKDKEIRRIMQVEETVLDRTEARKQTVRAFDENAQTDMASQFTHGGSGNNLGGHCGTASQRQWKKGGWGQKTPRTGYFGGEDWEGGGQPYKPIYICDGLITRPKESYRVSVCV